MRRQLLAAVLAVLVFAPVAHAWTWPATGAVLQPFLFDPAHPYAAGQHRGLDVGGEPGASVHAPAAGTVTFAGTVPSSGKSVTITTPDGYAVTLTHLGSITVARDAAVAEGDGVGTIGASGEPEVPQPYVHLGVRVAAESQGYLDPLTFLPARVPSPAALVPPVVVEPPPLTLPVAEPVPAPAADPEPVVLTVAAAAVPAPVAGPARPPVAVPEPAPAAAPVVPRSAAPEPVPAPVLDPAPPAVGAPAATAAEPVAPPVSRTAAEDHAVHGAASAAASRTAATVEPLAHEAAAPDDAPRRGGLSVASPPRQRARVPRAVDFVDRVAADVHDRAARSRPAAGPHAAARARAEAGVPVAAIAPRSKARQDGVLLPLLAAAAVLAAAVLARVLGAVRMMVRCGTDTEEDPGRSGVAVCSGSPSPRSRGRLRRPVGRVRPLSPAERQRRPHGEWDGRARHAGDGGRRQGGQVLR